MIWLFSVGVFVAVFSVVVLLHAFCTRKVEAIDALPWPMRMAQREFEQLAEWVPRSLVTPERSENRTLVKALRTADLPVSLGFLRSFQISLALGLAALMILVFRFVPSSGGVGIIFGSLLGAMVWVLIPMWLKSRARRRQQQFIRSLPYFLDLLTAALHAGFAFQAALNYVLKNIRQDALWLEFSRATGSIRAGTDKIEAFREMARAIDLPEFNMVVTSLAQSEQIGASLANTLSIQSEELRKAIQNRAERQAARAPVLLLFPMMLFILPGVFIILLAPFVIQMRDSGFLQLLTGS